MGSGVKRRLKQRRAYSSHLLHAVQLLLQSLERIRELYDLALEPLAVVLRFVEAELWAVAFLSAPRLTCTLLLLPPPHLQIRALAIPLAPRARQLVEVLLHLAERRITLREVRLERLDLVHEGCVAVRGSERVAARRARNDTHSA